MTIFMTADTHLGHDNIIGYVDRPFKDVEEHDEALIDNWNKVVGLEDTVYHLGDFAFGKTFHYINRLNGRIIIIRGNHDENTESIIRHAIIRYDLTNYLILHDPQDAHDTNHTGDVLCGHVHDRWKISTWFPEGSKEGRLCVNCGVDMWDYKPVKLDTLHKLIQKINKAKNAKSP